MESKGKITVGVGTEEVHQLNIEEYVQTRFKDNRLFSVAKIEDGSFAVSVENPPSTGRSNQTMWLSKESLVGLVSTILLYFEVKGEDSMGLLQQSVDSNNIEYFFSDNIQNQIDQTRLD